MIKIIANYDLALVAQVDKALAENDGYCPCAIDHNEDTKCMCKDFRENVSIGPCHCGRYRKIEVD